MSVESLEAGMTEVAASKLLAGKTRAMLAGVWERNLPLIEARLAVLDAASAADPLSEELRVEALNVTHKLAGSLGMFGFEQGTLIARQLEVALDVPVSDRMRRTALAKELRAQIFPEPPASSS